MLKVVIAEDEYLTRLGLQSTIDWEGNGYQIVGAASDGLEALSICERELPDIVISDLQMPKMNGIQLIRKLKEGGCRAKFLVLTCHTDFSYMQEAIRLNVNDYLVKATMEPEELLAVMQRLKESILRENADTYEREELHRMQREYQSKAQKENFRTFLVNGSNTLQGIPEFEIKGYSVLGLEHADQPCRMLLLDIDRFLASSGNKEEKEMLQRSMVNIAESIFPGEHIFLSSRVSAIVCIMLRERQSIKNELAEMREKAESLLRVTLSVISIKDEIPVHRLPEAYRLLHERLREKVFFHLPFTLEIKMTDPYAGLKSTPIEIKNLINDIWNKDSATLQDAFSELFKHLRQNRNGVITLGETLKRLQDIYEHCSGAGNAFVESPPDWTEVPQQFDSIELLTEWLAGQFNSLASLPEIEIKVENEMIRRAISYIRQNSSKNLTLAEVAAQSHMSISHFSHVFRNETGCSFITYCNEVRVVKAKLLLCSTDYKSGVIARMVGFDDESYFIRVFRQSTGMTPLTFRNNGKLSH